MGVAFASAHCTMSRRPTSLHGVARTDVLRVSSRTIGCQSAVPTTSRRSAPTLSCCACIRAPMKRARPTWHVAQVGRVEPLRSDDGGECAMARPLGTRTLHHFFLRRAVDTRTRSFCRTSLQSRAGFDCPDGSFASGACSARRRPTFAHASRSRPGARTSSQRAGVRRRAVGARCGDA